MIEWLLGPGSGILATAVVVISVWLLDRRLQGVRDIVERIMDDDDA